jgi:putative MATE family efflux protein
MSEPVDPAIAPRDPAMTMGSDLVEGPILRTLLAFSLPLLATNLVQTLNGAISAIWVGRLLGEAALAASAIANLVMFLLFGVIYGLGNASTIRIGHHFGAGDIEAARRAFAAGNGLNVIVALFAGLAIMAATPILLHALSTPPESIEGAEIYLLVSLAALPVSSLSMIYASGLRGAGDTRTPLYGTLVTLLLGVALNPVLILGLGPFPELGIAGAAIAASLASLGGTVLMIAMVQTRVHAMRLHRGEWGWLRPDRENSRYMIAKGIPMGAQMLAMSGAGLILIGLVNRQGLAASAAYGASLQIWNYLNMPAFAVGMAVSAMSAQCVGAGQHGRVAEITRVGLYVIAALTAFLALAIVALADPLLAMFLGDASPTIAIGSHILQICTWAFVIGSVVMLLNSEMRAYGEVMLPLIVMILAMYPGRIGFYFLARPWLGEEAVWWSYPAGAVFNIMFTWLAYSRGNWRHTEKEA